MAAHTIFVLFCRLYGLFRFCMFWFGSLFVGAGSYLECWLLCLLPWFITFYWDSDTDTLILILILIGLGCHCFISFSICFYLRVKFFSRVFIFRPPTKRGQKMRQLQHFGQREREREVSVTDIRTRGRNGIPKKRGERKRG